MYTKKTSNLSPWGADQLWSTWIGKSKDYAKSFSLPISPDFFYILHVDGCWVKVPFDICDKIYPFSQDPMKKPSIFRKQTVSFAKLFCIRKDAVLEVLGSSAYPPIRMVDKKSGKIYEFGSTAKICFRIADSEKSANSFYRNILLPRSDNATKDEASDLLRRIFVQISTPAMCALLEETYSFDELKLLTSTQKMDLSSMLYKRLKDVFSDFGITIDPTCEHTLIHTFNVRDIGNEPNESASTRPGLW